LASARHTIPAADTTCAEGIAACAENNASSAANAYCAAARAIHSSVAQVGACEAFDRAIDVHISSLRRKLGDDPRAPRFIETVRGAGYRIRKPDSTSDE
jgi:hypothetical protein